MISTLRLKLGARKPTNINSLGTFLFFGRTGHFNADRRLPVERNRGISSPKQVIFQSVGKPVDRISRIRVRDRGRAISGLRRTRVHLETLPRRPNLFI